MACSLTNKETGAKVRVLSSDPKRSHGPGLFQSLLRPTSLHNGRPPPVRGPIRQPAGAAWARLKTARFIALGTLAGRQSIRDIGSATLATATGRITPWTTAAAQALKWTGFSRNTWKNSNPAWGYFPELRRSIAKPRPNRPSATRPCCRLSGPCGLNAGVSDVAVSFLIDTGTSWREPPKARPPRLARACGAWIWGKTPAMSACCGLLARKRPFGLSGRLYRASLP